MSTPDLTSCYAAYCPACAGMVAVTVADVDEPVCLKRALQHRRAWERSGLTIKTVTVADIHGGALTGHAPACPKDPRAARALRKATPATEEPTQTGMF